MVADRKSVRVGDGTATQTHPARTNADGETATWKLSAQPAGSLHLPHPVVMPIARWEKVTEWPLTSAAVAFLLAYATPILWPGEDPRLTVACTATVWATWALFAGDFVVRVVLAERHGRYVLSHWLDVLIIALPLLRPLRLLRLITLLNVLNRRATSGLRGRLAIYVAGGSALLAFCGALAVLSVERGRGGNITSFADALWWAATTMTSVGYGDRYPVTGQGRLVAVALMLGGIALLGVVTAALATWLVENVAAAEKEQTQDLQHQLDDVRVQLHQVLARLPERTDELRPAAPEEEAPHGLDAGASR